MLKMLAGFWGKVRAYLFPSEEKASPQQQEDYFSLVEQARLEWHKAKDAFDQVSDPELIDHAVYNLRPVLVGDNFWNHFLPDGVMLVNLVQNDHFLPLNLYEQHRIGVRSRVYPDFDWQSRVIQATLRLQVRHALKLREHKPARTRRNRTKTFIEQIGRHRSFNLLDFVVCSAPRVRYKVAPCRQTERPVGWIGMIFPFFVYLGIPAE